MRQHFTADIGLKGVRVRRLIGTREGFDVYLGGGIAGQVHMGLPYKLGVDVDQLPTLVENVVSEYYLKHRSGQTFSTYWREKLHVAEADKVGDEDYQVPVWLCEACEYKHNGEDPPVFCPSCAGLRRNFARLEEGVSVTSDDEQAEETNPVRDDGFVFAANASDLSEEEGLTVEVQGREYALFLVGGEVRCIDSACPHEGASLADGEFKDGVVVCPWHSWEFDVCNGCSLDPPGNNVSTYETLVEEGRLFIKPQVVAEGATSKPATSSIINQLRNSAGRKPGKPVEAILEVLEVIQETPDVRTFRLDNSDGKVSFEFPGQFAKVCVTTDEGDVWRSFTISSSPSDKQHLDLTIKLNPDGIVSCYLFENVKPGGSVKLKGAQGGFFLDVAKHTEPLVLVSAGSGVTPMMSISRFLRSTDGKLPVTFLYGARSEADIIFHEECLQFSREHDWFHYSVTLSKPSESWAGECGRIAPERLLSVVESPTDCRYFLCGPNEFMESLQETLTTAGVAADRIHTEQFHKKQAPATV